MYISLVKITSILTIFYFSLNTTIERNKYPITIKTFSTKVSNRESKSFDIGEKEKYKIRKKTIKDLKYHLIKKNSDKEHVIQILVNQEGKIVGYKTCGIFYPNYFTKSQPQSIIKTSTTFNKNKTNLCLIKVKFHNAKIDL